MSGSYLYDFGDAMRFGASTAAEDCTELEKVRFDLDLFEAFTKGYLESAASVLTKREKELIFTSVILMTVSYTHLTSNPAFTASLKLWQQR